jgi:hypothetical protein
MNKLKTYHFHQLVEVVVVVVEAAANPWLVGSFLMILRDVPTK